MSVILCSIRSINQFFIAKQKLRSCIACLILFFSLSTYTLSNAQSVLGSHDIEFSVQPKYDSQTVESLFRKANTLWSSNVDSVFALLEKALFISRQINYDNGIASALLGIGSCYVNKALYDEGLKITASAFPYCLKAPNRNLLAMFYHNMHMPYAFKGETDTALYYLYRSLDEFNHIKHVDSSTLLLVYTNIAGLLSRQLADKEAAPFFHKALALAFALKDWDMLVHLYIGLGNYYDQKKDFELSRYYSNKAIELAAMYNKKRSQQVAYSNIGNTYEEENKPEQGIVYYKKALALGLIHPRYSLLNPYVGLGQAYFLLKEYDLSETYLLKALKVSQDIGARDRTIDVYGNLAKVYRAQKKYDKALQYQDSHRLLKDSLINEQKVLATHKWEVRYNTLEKDKEIALNQEVINRQQAQLKVKTFWMYSIFVGSFLLAALLITLYISYTRARKLQAERIKTIQQEQDINQLKAVMKGEEQERSRLAGELHDGIMSQLTAIRLNFTTLQQQNRFDSSEEADSILKQLVATMQELRTTTHNLMPEILLQEGLAEAVRIFCDKMEQASGLETDFQVYGTVYPMSAQFELSVYRMIQELVHNAIKYAQASQLLVQLNYNDESIGITVEDNGMGIAQNNGENKYGIGLRSIETRVKLLNGHMEFLENGLSGTAVYLEFDTKNANKPVEQWQ